MKKLFYENPYLSSWEADIERIENKNSKYYIVLSETAFYPEGGGQPSDKGVIDGIEVADLIEENGIIYHVLEKSPQAGHVKCSIDFKKRFDYMQQHSGQHLLSSIFYKFYNGKTAGFHLGEDYVTIDIALSEITNEQLLNAEDAVNECIYRNLNIKTYFINYDEALSHPLRKIPPCKENIRIVEIEDTDCTPCCGTHVKNTGEIGIVKIIKAEKYKGMTRIYFKCGKRALLDFQSKHNIVSNISKMLSARDDEIINRLEAKELQLKELSFEIRHLKDIITESETSELLKKSNTKIISQIYEDKKFDEFQRISKIILQKGSFIIILSSIPDRRILLCHDGSFPVNCGSIFKEHLKAFNGRGGGGDKQAQAGFETTELLIKFHKFLLEKLSACL